MESQTELPKEVEVDTSKGNETTEDLLNQYAGQDMDVLLKVEHRVENVLVY